MTLREKQSAFARLIPILFTYAFTLGYDITLGDAYRSVEEAIRLGKKNSLHTKRLAIDINLFKNGKYLDKTGDYQHLGEFWESLSTLNYTCCWGGRFNDGNHFSIAHNGVR